MALGECKRKASVPSRMLDSHLLYLAFRVALAFCPGERVKETFLLLYPSFLWEIIVFPYTFLEGCFLWDFFCRSDMEEESIYIYLGAKKASYFHAIKCRRVFLRQNVVCAFEIQKAASLRDDTAKNRMREVSC